MVIGWSRSARRAGVAWAAGVLVAGLAALPSVALAATPYDWLQFNGDPQHSGNDTSEIALTPANIGGMVRMFQAALPAVADGAPVALHGVSTPSGIRDLLFLTTKAGHILALDAHTGASMWSHQNGPGSCTINNHGTPCYTTSSPVIDPSGAFVYSYGLEGNVHKYAVGSGAETTTGGWPEPVTLKAFDEKGSSALAFATAMNGVTYLYVTTSGYPGDGGDYQGHVTAINLSTGSQQVFNSLCSNQTVHFVETPGAPDCSSVQSGIWARAAVAYHAATNRIFFATGNATFNPASDLWGDSLMSLNPDGTGVSGGPLDSYTPTDFQTLQNDDLDLGSTAPALLPPAAGSKFPHLAIQSGKDALLRLVNLDNLSGQGGPGHTGGEVLSTSVPQGGEVVTAPAVWSNPADGTIWAFVGNGGGISGLKLAIDASGNPSLSGVWAAAFGCNSPIVANAMVFCVGSGSVAIFDATHGTNLKQFALAGGTHWESPVVVNGVLYVSNESQSLEAFVVPGALTPALPPWALGLTATLLALVGLRAVRLTEPHRRFVNALMAAVRSSMA